MASSIQGGPITWSSSRDNDRHRTYKIRWLIRTTDSDDGPSVVRATIGLPQPGAIWNFGNDFDQWAWCQFDDEIKIHKEKEGDPARLWTVDQTFSTKPKSWCQDESIDDPLLRRPKISGGTVKYSEEAAFDRFGLQIQNSAFEQIRGPQAEFDRNRGTVKIDQNVATYAQIVLANQMMNTLNVLPLWGYDRRQIKLSSMQWTRQFYGFCQIYFNRVLEFDISLDHDRNLPDFGTMVLKGHLDKVTGIFTTENINGLPPNPNNQFHYIKFRGLDNTFRELLLDGAGLPALIPVNVTSLYYVSINVPNLNNPLTDTANWFPVVGGIEVPDWQPLEAYVAGNLVKSGTLIYGALLANTANTPAGNPTKWQSLTLATAFSDRGIWSATTDYIVGHYVRDPQAIMPGGIVHVEKYNESNFLLLGIPVDFTLP